MNTVNRLISPLGPTTENVLETYPLFLYLFASCHIEGSFIYEDIQNRIKIDNNQTMIFTIRRAGRKLVLKLPTFTSTFMLFVLRTHFNYFANFVFQNKAV